MPCIVRSGDSNLSGAWDEGHHNRGDSDDGSDKSAERDSNRTYSKPQDDTASEVYGPFDNGPDSHDLLLARA
jgi:hypothetical protein